MACKEMELEELRDRTLPSLSGGERQRTMIAQVIAQEPEIFLLDEPSSALDPNHALKLFRFLERMAAEGKTVAASAHDINLAAEFGSFVWIMKEGRLAAAGKTGDVLKGDVLSSVYGSTFVPYRREWTDFPGHPLHATEEKRYCGALFDAASFCSGDPSPAVSGAGGNPGVG